MASTKKYDNVKNEAKKKNFIGLKIGTTKRKYVTATFCNLIQGSSDPVNAAGNLFAYTLTYSPNFIVCSMDVELTTWLGISTFIHLKSDNATDLSVFYNGATEK